MPRNPIYMGELWCFIHQDCSDIEKTWFSDYHRKVYGDVEISWPDDVYEQADDENAARGLQKVADEMKRGDIIIVIINDVGHLLVCDLCSICHKRALLNVEMLCFRCGQEKHRKAE